MCYNVVQSRKGVLMPSTTMTIRLESEEKSLIAAYAEAFGTSVSEFMRKAALERIEDELDLKLWEEAKLEFDSDPVVLSAAQIAEKYL